MEILIIIGQPRGILILILGKVVRMIQATIEIDGKANVALMSLASSRLRLHKNNSFKGLGEAMINQDMWLLVLIILISMSLLLILAQMLRWDLSASVIKVPNKINLIPFFCLLITLFILLYFYVITFNDPLLRVAKSSFDYHFCMEQSHKKGHCVNYKNKLMASTIMAEMNGFEKKIINKAIDLGMYRAKSDSN
jgi:hypothetical protein